MTWINTGMAPLHASAPWPAGEQCRAPSHRQTGPFLAVLRCNLLTTAYAIEWPFNDAQ